MSNVPYLELKPDMEKAVERIYAWYQQEIIDRPPIRFTAHNSEFSLPHSMQGRIWPTLRDRWFDAEYQVEYFKHSIKGKKFLAETFPVFWPNLGPEVYTAFHGSELEYQEVTSYSIPFVKEWEDIEKIRFNKNNLYFKKIEELTRLSIELGKGQFLTGYTDLHPGMDCVAAWRDPQELCMDLMLFPEKVKELSFKANQHFFEIFDHFDGILKQAEQLSVTWLGIPSLGKMHIPSCDFSAMISDEQYYEFCHPNIVDEVKHFDHNIFHLDGKGVARHIDHILNIKEVNAIQWVQGMGDDTPIMQWMPLIKKIQAAGKSVILDISINELEEVIATLDPKGIMLCIAASEAIQNDIIKRVQKW